MMTYLRKIDGKWYAFECVGDQVRSIGEDNPKDGGRWHAPCTDSGIRFVASPSPSYNAAYKKARRHGDYDGII